MHDHQPMTLLFAGIISIGITYSPPIKTRASKRYAHADDIASNGGEAFGCLLPSLRMTECNAPSECACLRDATALLMLDNGFEQGGEKRANKQTH